MTGITEKSTPITVLVKGHFDYGREKTFFANKNLFPVIRRNNMKKVRFGVIGTNFITNWMINGARQDSRFELTAVCSRHLETAEAFAAQHNIPHIFTSVEEMARSSFIDAVYIASPNFLHAEQSILCMRYGKHVL